MSAAGLALALLLLNAAATCYMAGLVWFVQRVHYPLFAAVGPEGFPAYQRAHLERTSPVVAAPMLVEAVTAGLLVALPPAGIPAAAPAAGLALVALIWLSTGLLQVPRHRDLTLGFDRGTHRRLVATNWIRTAAWSLRAGLVLAMLFLAAGPDS